MENKLFNQDDYFSGNSPRNKQIIWIIVFFLIIVFSVGGFVYAIKKGQILLDKENSLLDDQENLYESDMNKKSADGDGYGDIDEFSILNNEVKMIDYRELENNNKYYNPDDFNAKKNFNVDLNESYCLSEREKKLHELFNNYRRELGLEEVSLSMSLSYVAKIHSIDIIKNSPNAGKCSGHSWSDKGNWSSCCYTLPPGPGDAECMRNKPRELTKYKGDGLENGLDTKPGNYRLTLEPEVDYTGILEPKTLIKGWKNSKEHNAAMINAGEAVGVGIYKVNSNLWFGGLSDDIIPLRFCSTNNFEYCSKLKNINLKDECYFEKAEYNNDIILCSNITQLDFRKDCYYYMILKENGYYDCPGTTNSVEYYNCRKNIRFKKEICDQLTFDSELQDRCYHFSAEINNNYKYCYLINNKNKIDQCLYKTAVSSKDEKVCTKIKEDYNKDLCLMEASGLKEDSSGCLGITDDQIRNSCYHKIAGEKKDLSLCENIVNLIECRDMTDTVCEHQKKGGGKDDCYSMVCKKLLPTERQKYTQCYDDFNDKIESSVDYCNRIQPGKARDYCFVGDMKNLNIFELCGYIEDLTIKNKCYNDAALKFNDKVICDYITEEKIKNICINTF